MRRREEKTREGEVKGHGKMKASEKGNMTLNVYMSTKVMTNVEQKAPGKATQL